MAYEPDSKSGARKGMWVRPPPRVRKALVVERIGPPKAVTSVRIRPRARSARSFSGQDTWFSPRQRGFDSRTGAHNFIHSGVVQSAGQQVLILLIEVRILAPEL